MPKITNTNKVVRALLSQVTSTGSSSKEEVNLELKEKLKLEINDRI